MLAAGRNVLALWQAQGKVQGEETVEAQLQCAYERLNAAVPERARERHAGRHVSHALSQAEVEAGEALRQRMRTKADARMEDAGEPEDASPTRRRINQLAEHVQVVLCGGGHGDLHRTQLLLAAVLDRPVVQRLLDGAVIKNPAN
jgi:hypothetical protein